MRPRAPIAAVTAFLAALVVAVAVAATPAHAGTWHITPSVINETTDPIALAQTGVDDGYFQTYPSQSLNPGNAPNENGNTSQYEFDAPHLDEGADGLVDYDTADGTQFNMLAQDDFDDPTTPTNSSPTCIDPDPTGPVPAHSCAATFGGDGPYPNNPSASEFSPYFNIRDNSPDAPAGARAAQVTAVGQTCDAQLTPGQSATCTASQPTMDGLSPTDPDNYQSLLFVDRSDTPVTVTATDTFMASYVASHPGGCAVFDQIQSGACATSTSCTMMSWGQTCQLQTSGGANSEAIGVSSHSYQQVNQAGNPTSDQISIAPASSAPSGSNWYGVRVYAESEVSRKMVQGVTLFDLFLDMAAAYGSTSTGPVYWVPDAAGRTAPRPGPPHGAPDRVYWNPRADDAMSDRSASLTRGATLRPGQTLRRGAFRLTMRPTGTLVEDVAVNGVRLPVWSSGPGSPGARATLGRDGRFVVRGRDGRVRWSADTHGRRATKVELDSDGRVVLLSAGGRTLFHTGAVTYPLPARHGAGELARGVGLTPGDELRRGGVRLTMQVDGNLVLTRAGRTLFSTHTRNHPGASARLRSDGALVVASSHGRVLWSSHTASRGARALTVRADGTIALLGPHRRTVWRAR